MKISDQIALLLSWRKCWGFADFKTSWECGVVEWDEFSVCVTSTSTATLHQLNTSYSDAVPNTAHSFDSTISFLPVSVCCSLSSSSASLTSFSTAASLLRFFVVVVCAVVFQAKLVSLRWSLLRLLRCAQPLRAPMINEISILQETVVFFFTHSLFTLFSLSLPLGFWSCRDAWMYRIEGNSQASSILKSSRAWNALLAVKEWSWKFNDLRDDCEWYDMYSLTQDTQRKKRENVEKSFSTGAVKLHFEHVLLWYFAGFPLCFIHLYCIQMAQVLFECSREAYSNSKC